MFEREKEKDVILSMKELFNEVFFARFNKRTDRLIELIDTWAPGILIGEEKEAIINNFDEMILAINTTKEKIVSIEAPTSEETKEFVEKNTELN